jgi:WD40 repeat protein
MTNHIFISYSKDDSDFAIKLAEDLQNKGFKIWIDRSIVGGDQWRDTIEKNLKSAEEVIVIVSPNSMASEWVKHEGSLAYGWGKRLIPILMEPVDSLPPWLEEYQWINFVDRSYKIAFDALVADITPPNPVQDLLDQQVNAYQQTNALINEAILQVIIEERDSLEISQEADQLIQKSKEKRDQNIAEREAQQQRELEQAHKLTKTQRQRTIVLSTGLVIAVVLSIIAFSLFQQSNYHLDEANIANTQSINNLEEANFANTRSAASAATAQAASTIAVSNQHLAENRAKVLLSKKLAAQSLELEMSQYDLSLLLAVQASNIVDTNESRRALLELLNQNPIIETFWYQGSTITPVDFSPDGSTLASITCIDSNMGNCTTSELRLWDLETRELVDDPYTFDGSSRLFQYSPDGETLAIIRNLKDENSIDIFSLNSQTFTDSFNHNAGSFSFSPDGKILASGGYDNEIILWDIKTGNKMGKPLLGSTHYVLDIEFSSDGKLLASSDANGNILIWDLEKRELISPPLVGHASRTGDLLQENVVNITLDTNNHLLASTDSEETNLWDLRTNEIVFTYNHSGYSPGRAFFTDNGRHLIIFESTKIIILDTNNLEIVEEYPIEKSMVTTENQISITDDKRYLAVSTQSDQIYIYDLGQIGILKSQPFIGDLGWVSSISINSKKNIYASGENNGNVRLWDLSTGQPMGFPLLGHDSWVRNVQINESGNLLVSSDNSGKVILWDLSSEPPEGNVILERNLDVMSSAFSPDGETLVVVASNFTEYTGKLFILDINSKTAQIRKSIEVDSPFTDVKFSPNGEMIATAMLTQADEDIFSAATLWDMTLDTPEPIPLPSEEYIASRIAFNSDGTKLALGGTFGINIWDVEQKELIGSIALDNQEGFSAVLSLLFTPDGETLITGDCSKLADHKCELGSIRFWEIPSLTEVGHLQSVHNGIVTGLGINQDGKILLSGGSDGKIYYWDIDLSSWKYNACKAANRNLTYNEWKQYLGDVQEYELTCPFLHPPEDAPAEFISENQIQAYPEPNILPSTNAEKWSLGEQKTSPNVHRGNDDKGGWKISISEMPDGLELIYPAVVQCRENSSSDRLTSEYLTLWAINVNKDDEWVKKGQAEVIVKDDGDQEIERYEAIFSLAADSVGWILPEKNANWYAISGAHEGETIFELTINQIEWQPNQESIESYSLNSQFWGHWLYGNENYPQHSIGLQIQNSGKKTIKMLSLWGFVETKNGEVVDIFRNDDSIKRLLPDHKGYLIAKSISISGRCVGSDSPDGYIIHYWVDFLTEDGQVMTIYDIVETE